MQVSGPRRGNRRHVVPDTIPSQLKALGVIGGHSLAKPQILKHQVQFCKRICIELVSFVRQSVDKSHHPSPDLLSLTGIKAGSAHMTSQLFSPCSLSRLCPSWVPLPLGSALLTRVLDAHHSAYGFVKLRRRSPHLVPPELS